MHGCWNLGKERNFSGHNMDSVWVYHGFPSYPPILFPPSGSPFINLSENSGSLRLIEGEPGGVGRGSSGTHEFRAYNFGSRIWGLACTI